MVLVVHGRHQAVVDGHIDQSKSPGVLGRRSVLRLSDLPGRQIEYIGRRGTLIEAGDISPVWRALGTGKAPDRHHLVVSYYILYTWFDNSEGTWQFFRDDINDGYGTAQWIGSQPWSNCAIGTVGASYPGGTQHALALSNAPCLKAMIPAYATSDAGRVGLRHNGAFELRWMNWIFNLFEPEGDRDGARNKEVMAKLGEQVREYVKGLPLRPGTTPLRLIPTYEHWLVEAILMATMTRIGKMSAWTWSITSLNTRTSLSTISAGGSTPTCRARV